MEGRLGIGTPDEPILAQETGERGCDGPVIFDESAIVAGQSEECSDCTNRLGHGPIQDGAHLMVIHSDTGGGNHVAEIDHFTSAEGTLGFLHGKLMLLQFSQHQIDVVEML
jgi:hypothetical protein